MLQFLVSLLLLPALSAAPAQTSLPPIRVQAGDMLTVTAPTTLAHFSRPNLSASGAILVDVSSGEEIFSIRPDLPRPMASLTKIMTALILTERHAPTEVVTIPRRALNVQGSKLHLKEGERFTLQNLLSAMLLPSANDVAYALALFHSQSVDAFVKTMNERARSLGLTHTHFTNPAGLDSDLQYASPRDLAWLTIAAIRHPTLQRIVQTKSATVTNLNGKTYALSNTNTILHSQPNVFGVKTGTTGNAGECLIVLFTEGRRSFALVLLGSNNRYTDALHVMQAVHASLL